MTCKQLGENTMAGHKTGHLRLQCSTYTAGVISSIGCLECSRGAYRSETSTGNFAYNMEGSYFKRKLRNLLKYIELPGNLDVEAP